MFWNLLFWTIIFLVLFNPSNFLNLFLYSEIVWITLYIISLLIGSNNDDITLFSLTFFLLAIAGLEFSLGFLIIILFKNFKKNLNFEDNNKINNQFLNKNLNKIFLNKSYFNYAKKEK